MAVGAPRHAGGRPLSAGSSTRTTPGILGAGEADLGTRVDTLVVGAGAAGAVAALAAAEAGREVVALERDPVPAGSTSLSAGLVPAAGTCFQREAGIDDDTPARFAADILAKNHGEADPAIVALLTEEAGPAVTWLAEAHGVPFGLVDDFDYPGHSRRRMHGTPARTGTELLGHLHRALARFDVPVLTEARVTHLVADGRTILGARIARPDGTAEDIGCERLVLACNGFGGNREMVAREMPDITDALWFGHSGNEGEAVVWGRALGAATRHMGAYQGHGSVAHPHGILITWATMTEGGFQVNRHGRRFHDEARGYSEAARAVLAEPDAIAFSIFDDRIAAIARQFEDFRAAEAAGAIVSAETADTLADHLAIDRAGLSATFTEVATAKGGAADPFGRAFAGAAPLQPPYRAVRVTGALFHTQGGLAVDRSARVLGTDGAPFPNLFAAGGAAAGVSGEGDDGYLSGNGLLAAVVLGRIAGS